MKCGDRGFKTVNGTPCGQTIGARAKACIWHSRTPEERTLMASRASLCKKNRRLLPADFANAMVPFNSRESVIQFAQDLARRVLTEDVDPRRIDSALRAAGVALNGFAAQTQEKLVDALLRLEHGGAAFALLARLQDGLNEGRRRPLPGRALTISQPEPEPEPEAVGS